MRRRYLYAGSPLGLLSPVSHWCLHHAILAHQRHLQLAVTLVQLEPGAGHLEGIPCLLGEISGESLLREFLVSPLVHVGRNLLFVEVITAGRGASEI